MVAFNPKFFFTTPIQVVKVTSENLEQAAEWCGGLIQEVASRRVEGRMDPYVLVPTPKAATTSWAFPGMIITKRIVVNEKGELKSTYAVFRKDYFDKNYFASINEAVKLTWDRAEKEERESEHVKTAMETAMAEAIQAEAAKKENAAVDSIEATMARHPAGKAKGNARKPFEVEE